MKATKKKCPKKKSLALMFWYGTEEHELALCFKDSKIQLIRAKAKAQNLPKTTEQEIDLLLALSPEAMDIIRNWFRENAKFENLRKPETALEILKALPKNKIDSEEFKGEWRSILSLYSEKSIPQNLMDFLQSSDITKIGSLKQVSLAFTTPPIENNFDRAGFFVTQDMVQSCQKSFEEDRDTPTDNILTIFLEGAIAATKRDEFECKKAKDSIVHVAGVLGPDLKALIDQLENNSIRTGLRLRKASSTKNIPDIDPEIHCAVAEIIKTLPSGQFFAKVIGMVVDNNLVELSTEEARNVYPLAGEILAFPNTITGHHHDGDWGVWRTDRLPTDKKNKFVIKSHEARIYDVISVPYPSSNPDGVREWLINNYDHSSSIFPIFELSDQLLIRLPGDLKDPQQFKFENPVDLYESLDAFLFASGRRVVLGPIPLAVRKLDCALPITIIKRMLKLQDATKQFPAFSRQQVDALSELIKAEKNYPFKSSFERAQKSLLVVSDIRENLDEIILEMLSLPKVSKKIEEEKKYILDKFAAEQNEHQIELQKLKGEKIKLEGDISVLKKSLKAQEQQLLSLIKDKFQKAQEEGVETLAQSALIRGVIGHGQRAELHLNRELIDLEGQLASLEIGNQLASVHELKLALGRAAYATGFSSQLMSTVISSARACGVVGLVGARWGATAQLVSTVLTAGVRCTVSVSADMFSLSDLLRSPALISVGSRSIGLPLGDFLQAQSSLGRSSVVELTGSNRVPPESYLPELIELLSRTGSATSVAWADGLGQIKTTTINSPVLLLLGFVSGKSTFSFDAPLSSQIPIVAVDTLWGDEPDVDKLLTFKPSHLSINAWSELGMPQHGYTSSMFMSISDVKERLSRALQRCDCRDPAVLAQALLEAGRPDSIINSNEGEASTKSLVMQLLDVMHSSSHNLFARSHDI